MTRPAGTKATKDNSRKLHANREEWMAGKKLGRSKQAWVWEEPMAVPAGRTTNWPLDKGLGTVL